MKLYQVSNPILALFFFFSFGIERCFLKELISKEELRSINNTVRCAHTLHEPILSVPYSETLICGSSNTYRVIEIRFLTNEKQDGLKKRFTDSKEKKQFEKCSRNIEWICF